MFTIPVKNYVLSTVLIIAHRLSEEINNLTYLIWLEQGVFKWEDEMKTFVNCKALAYTSSYTYPHMTIFLKKYTNSFGEKISHYAHCQNASNKYQLPHWQSPKPSEI